MRRLLVAVVFAIGSDAAALEAGAPLPSLAVARLGEPAQSLSLASLKGDVVYVDFWASWCVPCRLSMPALDTLYRAIAAAASRWSA